MMLVTSTIIFVNHNSATKALCTATDIALQAAAVHVCMICITIDMVFNWSQWEAPLFARHFM